MIIYYCYTIPRESERELLEERRGGRGRGPGGKDLPPSYNSIHFSELPPHYEVYAG